MRRLGLAFILLLLPLHSVAEAPVTYTTAPLDIRTQGATMHFTVEQAITRPQLENGLMLRKNLPDKHGMVFLFSPPQKVVFWMKNTLIPLDMLFVDAGGIITQVVANAKPESLDFIPAKYDTHLVIELMGGSAARYHIVSGNKVIYKEPQ